MPATTFVYNNLYGFLQLSTFPTAVDNSKEQLPPPSCTRGNGAWIRYNMYYHIACESIDSSGNVGTCTYRAKSYGKLIQRLHNPIYFIPSQLNLVMKTSLNYFLHLRQPYSRNKNLTVSKWRPSNRLLALSISIFGENLKKKKQKQKAKTKPLSQRNFFNDFWSL